MAVKFKDTININGEYTFPNTDGSVGQAIITDGGGNLTFGSVAAASADSAESTHLNVKNTSGASIAKGTPVYVTGNVGNTDKLEIAPADASNASHMPAIGLLESTLANNGEGFVVQGGLLKGLVTDTIDGSSSTANDTVYVKAGGGLTLTKPTGSTNFIQNIAKVARVHSSNGSLIVSSILRTNDVPNLPEGKIWVGDDNTTVSTIVHLDELNGRVGIGTDSPNGRLNVKSTDSTTDQITLTHSGNTVNLVAIGQESSHGSLILRNNSGVNKVRLSAAGNTSYILESKVGIGTTLPDYRLQVNDNIYTGLGMYSTYSYSLNRNWAWQLNTFGSGNWGGIGLWQSSSEGTNPSSGQVRFGIDLSGNVGIGTTSPTSILHLADTTPRIKIQDTTDNSVSEILYNAGGLFIRADQTDIAASSRVVFEVDATERMRIDSSGRVGIGTTSPNSTLHLYSASNTQITFQDASTGVGSNDGFRVGWNGTVAQMYLFEDADMRFATNDTERMRIHSGGDISFRDTSANEAFYWDASASSLGIGTTSPTNPLEVLRTTGGWATYIKNVSASSPSGLLLSAGNSSGNFAMYVRNAAETSDLFAIKGNGNVGIGIASPSQKLHIEGNARITGALHDSNNSAGTSGQVLSSTATGTDWISLSEISGVDGSGTANYVPKWTDGDTIGNSVIYDNGVSVGIGTTTPTGTLDVSGTITATGGNSTQWNEAYSWGNPQALMSDISFGESYISNHRSRVLDNTGTYFPSTAGYDLGVLKNQGFMDKASLIFLPTGVKDGGLFSVKPKNVGDFDFTRATTATYVDEDGLIAIAPSNTPRLDYPIVNGVVQATPSLLLEPASTNLVTYSEDFSNSAWIKSNSTITSNSEISPDGTQNSYTLTTLVAGAAIQDSLSVSDGNVTFSVFVKKGTTNGVRIRIDAATDSNAFFNLVTNTIYSSDDDAKIENYGNGWYRISISANITSFVKAVIYTTDGTSSYDNGTLHIYGAQLEQGSYATSYIPTQGAAVTRVAETCTGAGNEQVINSTEGVLYAELLNITSQNFDSITINDESGTDNNQVRIWFFNNTITYQYNIGGVTSAQISSGTIDLTLENKIACSWKLNEFKLFVNGVQIGITDNSGAVLSTGILKSLDFKRGRGDGNFYGNCKDLRVYNTALTDEQLAALTTI